MSQKTSDKQPDLTQPLKNQYLKLVIIYTPNVPMNRAYEIVRKTMTKKPESRQDQLDICQSDANHIANGLLFYARMLHSLWFAEYGITQMQAIESICEYLLIPNPPQIENSPAVALALEFDPDKKRKERYSIERESVEEKKLTKAEQFEVVKTDMKHFANGARYMANFMEHGFGSEFNLTEKEVLGNLCSFLKATIKGTHQELDVLHSTK